MQFSIFGVPFKFTKDMFTLEKAKWSIFVFWAQLWRGAMLSLAYMVGIAVTVVRSDLFQELMSKADDPMYDKDQIFIDWYHSTNFTGFWWILGAGILVMILVISYIQYYVLIKKNYRSFVRGSISEKIPQKFWSGSFWKRFIISLLYSFIIWIGFVLTMIVILAIFGVVTYLVSLIPGAVGFAKTAGIILAQFWAVFYVIGSLLLTKHTLLHGGTWGFVPVAKQPKIEGSEVKS